MMAADTLLPWWEVPSLRLSSVNDPAYKDICIIYKTIKICTHIHSLTQRTWFVRNNVNNKQTRHTNNARGSMFHEHCFVFNHVHIFILTTYYCLCHLYIYKYILSNLLVYFDEYMV